MKGILQKCITTIICFTIVTLVLAGCSKKDYSSTASELLKTLSIDVMGRGGIESQVRIITINLSDFKDYPIDEYIEWVTNEYSNENCFVFALKDGKDPFVESDDLKNFLLEQGYDENVTYDWTDFYFDRVSEESTLSKKEKITTHISYVSIQACEGWDIEVVYKNNQWKIKKTEHAYMS